MTADLPESRVCGTDLQPHPRARVPAGAVRAAEASTAAAGHPGAGAPQNAAQSVLGASSVVRQRSKVQVKVRLPTATKQALDAIAAARGVSLSDVIVTALQAALRDRGGTRECRPCEGRGTLPWRRGQAQPDTCGVCKGMGRVPR